MVSLLYRLESANPAASAALQPNLSKGTAAELLIGNTPPDFIFLRSAASAWATGPPERVLYAAIRQEIGWQARVSDEVGFERRIRRHSVAWSSETGSRRLNQTEEFTERGFMEF
jgi:hypothetical protein